MAKNKKSSKKKTTTTTTTTVVTTTTTSVEKKLDTHYLLVLDRSGSMSSCWDSTIEGLNEQLGTIRALDEKYPEQRYFLTLVAFDNEIETIIEDRPVSEVENFTGDEFPPRGMTALHDAMGISISKLKANLDKKNKESDNISTALVVVMTDGAENCSKEYNSNSIKELVDELNATDAWTFSYMGANQDAILTASNFGISAGNSINYASTEKGAGTAYKFATRAFASRAEASNVTYTATVASGGDVSLDTLNMDNTSYFSSVAESDTIGEDDSDSKEDNA